MATLEELLVGKTADEIVDILLGYLNAEKVDPNDPSSAPAFAVSDWESGGIERTNVEMEARALEDLVSEAIPSIAAGSLITKAEGKWLELRASDVYKITKQGATQTRIQLRLTDGGAGPFTVGAGELIWQTESGLRFFNEAGVTVPLSDSVNVVVKAEGPGGHYNVATGALNHKWVTPLPGVESHHETLKFSAMKATQAGDGIVAPTELLAVISRIYKVVVTSNGNVGAGSIEWFINGVSAGTASPIPATQNLDAYVQVGFANGASSPSFVRDDTFEFSTLASPIVEPGRDAEGDVQLRRRCQARWPNLALIPTDDKYVSLAKDAYVGVTKVSPFPSDVIAGMTRVVVAGQAVLGPANLTDIQSYIELRDGVGDRVAVEEATGVNLSVSGTVIVPALKEAAIKTAAQAAWDLYVDDEIEIGGIARIFELKGVLEDAGAIDVNLVVFAGANEPSVPGGTNVNVQLGQTEVARSTSLAADLTWKAV